MPVPRQDSNGNYLARKRIPDDVRGEYKRRYGARYEAKLSIPKTVAKDVVVRRYGEWLTEIDSRFSAIRSEQDGTGRSLTREDARRLAGEWYEWFINRRSETSLDDLEWRRDAVSEAFKSSGVSERDLELFDPFSEWADALGPLLLRHQPPNIRTVRLKAYG
jgi:hypothetical protein